MKRSYENLAVDAITKLKAEVEKYKNRLGEKKLAEIMYDHFALSLDKAENLMELINEMIPKVSYDAIPKDWFFEAEKWQLGKVCPECRVIEIAKIDPKLIAEKIDKWANKDITEDSKKANEIAEKISWTALHDKYINLFKSLL